MEPTHSNDGSQGGFPGGNVPPYPPTWNAYHYGFPSGMPQPTPSGFHPGMHQPTPSGFSPGMPQPSQSWYHPGMPQPTPNVGMIHPSQHGPQVFVPAENTTAFVQNDDEGVDGHPICSAPKGKGKKAKVHSRTKLSNFSVEEDINLVRSWVEISNDPITCNAQKKDGMWLKIMGRYELRRGSYPERSVKSLQSRWDAIKAETGKFASIYADVVRDNPSGMTDGDKTTHAAALFASVHDHNFAYLNCWEILKDEPKFQDVVSRGVPKSAGGDGFGEERINLGEDNSAPTEPGEKRPMGRDRAKALKKKEKSDAGSTSSEYASRMQDLSLQRISIMQEESANKTLRFDHMRSHHESLLHLEQEKFRMAREKHDQEREEKDKQEDERILAIDLSVCNPAQQVYYKDKQEEILEKIAARRRNR